MLLKIGIITLGCDKNTVDTEYLAALLEDRGHEIVIEGEQSALDALVVYTCGFIGDARDQSCDTIRAFSRTKREFGNPRRLIMVGCLCQREPDKLREQLPEVDAFFGVGRPRELADLIEEIAMRPADAGDLAGCASDAPNAPSHPNIPAPLMRMDAPLRRKRLDNGPFAYLKIADGCNHACSFCAIPAMKGPYISVPREIVLQEAADLVRGGVREINLIAQDISPYGRDLYDDYELPDLLRDLAAIEGDFWLRLLYFYPAGLTPRFMNTFQNEPKICKYLDIPLQHLDSRILKAMNRPAGDEGLMRRIAELRQAIPDIVLRTTMITGFPGETPAAFQNLLKGIGEIQFERLGAFAYSPEQGTPAAEMGGAVSAATARHRLDLLMKSQAKISLALQRRMIGKTLRVLVESIDASGKLAIARSYREAPDVDGNIIITLPSREKAGITIGDFLNVRITKARTHDLVAEIIG